MRTTRKDSLQHGLTHNQMVLYGSHLYYFKKYLEDQEGKCKIGTTPGDDPTSHFTIELENIRVYREEEFVRWCTMGCVQSIKPMG